MDTDDEQIGRVLSRRAVLRLFGLTSTASLLASCGLVGNDRRPPGGNNAAAAKSTDLSGGKETIAVNGASVPSCVVAPALTEGPYFVDEKLNRSDVRSDPSDNSVREGVLLKLAVRVLQVNSGGCAPLQNAVVDIWHCDAAGVYSDVSGSDSAGKKFLRGYQLSDANGLVNFQTVYPGWYPGRATHIHFKVRTTVAGGKTSDFTAQWFFDEALNDTVYANAPYLRSGSRQRNESDGIFGGSNGKLTLNVTPDGAGYAAQFDLGVAI